jgi:hypothetical protein
MRPRIHAGTVAENIQLALPYGNSLGFDVAEVAWSMFKHQLMK